MGFSSTFSETPISTNKPSIVVHICGSSY
jgi:hypothetical protein